MGQCSRTSTQGRARTAASRASVTAAPVVSARCTMRGRLWAPSRV